MKQIIRLSAILSIIATAPSAAAYSDHKDDELRSEIRCKPTKNVRKIESRFDDLKASKRDTVDAVVIPQIIIRDEGGLPDRIYLKHNDEEIDIAVNSYGKAPDLFTRIIASHEDTQVCVQDKARAGTSVDVPGAGLTLPISIRFKNNDGVYDMAEIDDGLKDGKSFYKKMAPGPMALLVPSLTHLVITYVDQSTPPQFVGYKGEELVGDVTIEPFDGSHVIKVKDLKDLGATHLKVLGGPHAMSPATSIKIMRKFGVSGE